MQHRSVHSNSNGLRRMFIALAAITALGVSAAAGALVHSRLSEAERPKLSADQERFISDQISRDSAYVRENVSQLAAKVGNLQAQLIAMGGLSKRVADAAGVSYTDPEVLASLAPTDDATMAAAEPAIMDDIHAGGPPQQTAMAGSVEVSWTAEGLGRQLDEMTRQLSEQKDWFSMLDLVLTKRQGAEAGLPDIMPVDYPYLSSSFGWRRHPISGRHIMHEGLDFAAPRGTPIHAASGGVVTEARYVSGYGKLIEINHGNGVVTRYAHASSLNVKQGDLVEKGQMIARVGSTGRSTGPHLHFEVRMAGHPLDPTLFLPQQEDPAHLVASASSSEKAIVP